VHDWLTGVPRTCGPLQVTGTAPTRMLFKFRTATKDAVPWAAVDNAATTIATARHWHLHCCHLYRCSWKHCSKPRYRLGCDDLAITLLTESLPTWPLLPCETITTYTKANMALGAALGALAFAAAGLATSGAAFAAPAFAGARPRRVANMPKPSILPTCSAAKRASSSALVT
jgi:hypothetical protein